MITYNIRKSYYTNDKDETISVPSKMRFIYKDGSIGKCLKRGFNHYLGIVHKNDSEGYKGLIFGDYIFKVFNNIIMYDNIPSISSEELVKLLSEYYIYFTVGAKYIYSGDFEINKISEEKLYCTSKILNIEGPFDVEGVFVQCGSMFAFDNTNVNNISLNQGLEINKFCEENEYYGSYDHVEVSKDSSKFIETLTKVLNNFKINKELQTIKM